MEREVTYRKVDGAEMKNRVTVARVGEKGHITEETPQSRQIAREVRSESATSEDDVLPMHCAHS